MRIPTLIQGNAKVIVSRSVMSDLPAWRDLAIEVEPVFGAPMAEDEDWNARLINQIQRGTAWCARLAPESGVVGGMWLAFGHSDALTIGWLAVRREARRRGVGRCLVERALAEAGGRPVRVVTFGHGHPMGAEVNAARIMYHSLGFEHSTERPPEAPDGTSREVLRHPGSN